MPSRLRYEASPDSGPTLDMRREPPRVQPAAVTQSPLQGSAQVELPPNNASPLKALRWPYQYVRSGASQTPDISQRLRSATALPTSYAAPPHIAQPLRHLLSGRVSVSGYAVPQPSFFTPFSPIVSWTFRAPHSSLGLRFFSTITPCSSRHVHHGRCFGLLLAFHRLVAFLSLSRDRPRNDCL